jgi:hypothetical protein
MIGLSGDQLRDILADLTAGQEFVGLRQIEPERTGQGQSAAALVRSHLDGQGDLIGDAPAKLAVVHPGRPLRVDLRLCELHGLGGFDRT